MKVIQSVVLSIALLSLYGNTAQTSETKRQNVVRDARNITPLAVGSPVPDVALSTKDGERVKLKAKIQQPTVVVFYRGGWCPYCNVQLAGLATVQKQLKSLGFSLLAISPDRPSINKASLQKDTLSYTLLSDTTMQAAKAFGIAFKLDDQTITRYKQYDIDLEAASGRSHNLLPVPSVFIVDQSGIIRFVHADPDYKVRLSEEKLLAAARRLAAQQ